MFGFKNIYEAYVECRRGKRATANALAFELCLVDRLCELETSLNSRTYRPSRSICFLSSSPKLREIFAADFGDRVVHHLLTPYLQKIFEPKFIYDVYNNRVGKGIHKAVQRAQKFAATDNRGYYLQLDIKNFFYSIDKNILFKKLYEGVQKSGYDEETKQKIAWLSNIIIYNDVTKNYIFKGDKYALGALPSHKSLFGAPKHLGLPIGNLTSQFFANLYLNDFDHFVKRELKRKRYIRYVDDFVIFGDDKEELARIKQKIEEYLQVKLKLTLRDDYRLRAVRDGLDFLGYIVRPHYMLVRKRVVNNYKYKKARFLDRYEMYLMNNSPEFMRVASGGCKGRLRPCRLDSALPDKACQNQAMLEDIKQFLSVQASFLGHIKHANSHNLKQKVGIIDDEKYIRTFMCRQ